MALFGAPLLFVSYARADQAWVDQVVSGLQKMGFKVFYDQESIHAGDNFVDRIVREIARSDGVIALISEASANSPWCQAELYNAHALGKRVIPLSLGEEPLALAVPLQRLQRDIQLVRIPGPEDVPRAIAKIGNQLSAIRSLHRLRLALRLAMMLLVLTLMGGTILWAARKVDVWQMARERDRLVQTVATSRNVFPQESISREVQRFGKDRAATENLLYLSQDSTLSGVAQFNALLLAHQLLRPVRPEKHRVLTEINWNTGDVDGIQLVDVTFKSGDIHAVRFHRSTFANVHWVSSPDGASGLSLSDALFDGSRFFGGSFSGTKVIGARFVNSKFYGSEVEVTNFSLASFETASSRPADSNVITDEIGLFENSILSSRLPPTEPGVLDLSNPKEEVQFRGVIFTNCRLRGRFRPEWFEGCSFYNCVLPVELTQEKLAERQNQVEDGVWKDEPAQ